MIFILNNEKIKLMTAMAIDEKRYGKEDKYADSYHMEDYIFKKNSWTRILVFIGFLILLAFYFVINIVNENLDIFTIDVKAAVIKFAVILVAVLALYTFIGTNINKRKYIEAEGRLEKAKYLQKKVSSIELYDIVNKLSFSNKQGIFEPAQLWLKGSIGNKELYEALKAERKIRGKFSIKEEELYKKLIRIL